MINIAILDDNKEDLVELGEICIRYFKDAKYIASINIFSSSQEFLNSEVKYDIIFLDIEIPDINGIEVANIIRTFDKDCCICFISNYNKYALKSYNAHAFDYIEKPISQNKIFKTLDQLFAYYGMRMINKTKIVFPLHYSSISLVASEILYFEYFDSNKDYFNRSTIVYTLSDKYALKMKISSVYEMLPVELFTMPHKSFIVNFSNISSIKGNIITMKNGAIVPLSQKRAAKFRIKFNEYIKKYLIG